MTDGTSPDTLARAPRWGSRPGAAKVARGKDQTRLEQGLARVSRVAARLLDVPAAVVTLRVEGRVGIVASYGLGAVRWGSSPLSLSLGEPRGAQALAIPDIARDALLGHDPLHVESGFRAFLALPVSHGTEVRGSLCALAREVRNWSSGDQEDLELAAALVLSELELLDLKQLEQARDRALEDLERVTHLLSCERTTLEEQARELQKLAFALQRSNRELDQFAYVASHDLKAPLRGIASITQWLVDDLKESLDDETRGYLQLLESRVSRMERLIDGVLRYARAGRSRGEPETVEVARLVGDVLDMLAPPERFRVRIEGYMPVIISERSPLQQVFLNLIGNALRHADSEEPDVRVSVSDEGGGWYEFSVADNGPGIAAEHHERIFTIFQTLSRKDEVDSTGIGLSIVKRIVESHGGQVWVESSSGRGATFRFLWPEAPRETREGAAWKTAR